MFRPSHIWWNIRLVGGLEHFLFFHLLGIIIPTDFHIFQRGRLNHQPDILLKSWDFPCHIQKFASSVAVAGITFYEGGVGLVEDGVIEGGLAAWRFRWFREGWKLSWRWILAILGSENQDCWMLLGLSNPEKQLKHGNHPSFFSAPSSCVCINIYIYVIYIYIYVMHIIYIYIAYI